VNAGTTLPSTQSPLVWRSRILRLSLAAVPTWFTIAVLVFDTPWRTKLLVGSVFATALISPSRGLLAVAFLTPLGHLLETGLGLEPFRISEAIVIAFLAGWLLGGRGDRSGPRVPAIAAWSLAGVACASVAAQAWSVAGAHPGELADTLQTLYQAYYLLPDRIGFGAAARLLEGLALLAATTTLFRATPRLAVTLPATMTVSAVLAAASSALVTRGVAPAAILAEHARLGSRTSAHIGDVNAAASYFGMLLFVALGMAARRRSALSALWLAAAIAEAAALWLTGSRTGIAAAVIVFGVAAVCAVTAEWKPTMRAVAVATILFTAAAAGGARMWMLRNDPGASFRRQFTSTSFRMIAARPVLGVGVGRYYDASGLFLTPQMAWVYGFQNAHNHFLQIAAELGLVGLALFLTLIGRVVARGARAFAVRAEDMRLLGCVAGVVALLTTCLAGHPLLLDEVAFTFWMLVGLVAGLGGSIFVGTGGYGVEGAGRAGGPATVAAMAVVGMVAVGDLLVARQPLTPPSSTAVDGLESWETDADGTRHRWTHEYASVFVPWNVTRVYIPARLPVDLPHIPPMLVDARVAGVGAGSTLVGDSWTVINVEIPPLSSLQRYKRVDLRVPRTWQPAIYLPGSRDLRKVGVQVGEVKLFYEY
jgi:O-antigen ligase